MAGGGRSFVDARLGRPFRWCGRCDNLGVMAFVLCESCDRHVLGSESVCPFCRASRARAWLTAVAVSSALAVAACSAGAVYAGPPPGPPQEPIRAHPVAGETPTTEPPPSEGATPTEDAKAPDATSPHKAAEPSPSVGSR